MPEFFRDSVATIVALVPYAYYVALDIDQGESPLWVSVVVILGREENDCHCHVADYSFCES